MVLLIVHWAMLGGEEEYKRRQKTPGICSGGLTFEDEDAGGGGFDLCYETHWHDYILGGKCNYREDCSLYRNTSVYIKVVHQRRSCQMLTIIIAAVVDFYTN